MQACNQVFLHNGQTSVEAMHSMSKTLSLLNQRLTSPQALHDSTISLILALIHQELFRQQHADAQVHAKGVDQMIELRGGLEKLEANHFLVLKICK